MASKLKTNYICQSCGSIHPKWSGQCNDCGDWNNMVEQTVKPRSQDKFSHMTGSKAKTVNNSVQLLGDIKQSEHSRISTNISELDRVMGGGMVKGSVTLLGGDPGIGKSTLLLQALAGLSANVDVLYASGEESVEQVGLRASRLHLTAPKLKLVAENHLETIISLVQKHQPDVLVIDSIQTIYSEELQSAPGSVSQVRDCSAHFVRMAKQTGCAIVLVGHVTKDGNIAGPRILEHMVDTVLYFEGDRQTSFRIIRGIKNRFGTVNEMGVFAMTDVGLKEVTNPSAMFIAHSGSEKRGSVILSTVEGTRPLLVEVQALVDQSSMANPRRLTVGLEQNRLAMILAILHKHVGVMLHNQDVFVSVIGGIRVNEPAADLAIAVAVLTSDKHVAVDQRTVVFGELGLTGEIRPVQKGQERIKEAVKLGFKRIILPKGNMPKKNLKENEGIEFVPIESVADLPEAIF